MRLELKSALGTEETSEYRSVTQSSARRSGQANEETIEEFNFNVQTKTISVDSVNKTATYRITTLKKDGSGALADFAMPEVGDSIDMVITNLGQVIKAGEALPGTIYYVPPISLPKDEVKVGDTWLMKSDWVNLTSGVPLHLEVVSTLKALRSCGSIGRCAEIEVSGDETIIGETNSPLFSSQEKAKKEKRGKKTKVKAQNKSPRVDPTLQSRFKSQLKGKLLFAIDQGLVLFSHIKSEELLAGEKTQMAVHSCTTSTLTESAGLKSPVTAPTKCDPNGPLVEF